MAASASICIIQNQAAYGCAWTSYFVGQRKCVPIQAWTGGTACAEITSAGRVQWYRGGAYMGFSETPIELNSVSFRHNMFTDGLVDVGLAWPVGYSAMTGTAPTDWTLSYTQSCPACN